MMKKLDTRMTCTQLLIFQIKVVQTLILFDVSVNECKRLLEKERALTVEQCSPKKGKGLVRAKTCGIDCSLHVLFVLWHKVSSHPYIYGTVFT